jgi:hypothetical protein
LYRKPASAIIFKNICSAQDNNRKEALCIEYNAVLLDYLQAQLDPIIHNEIKLHQKNENCCYMVTSRNKKRTKINLLFTAVSSHNRRGNNSLDIMTRLLAG